MNKIKISLSKLNIFIVISLMVFSLGLAINYYLDENFYKAIMSIIVMIFPPVIFIIPKSINIKLPPIIKTYYLILIFLSIILGGAVGFYDIPTYDKYIHFLSGILISLAIIKYLEDTCFLKNVVSRDISIFFVIFFNATIAVFWEICEYTYDLLFHQTAQNGLNDTMLDMILGIIGGLLVVFCYIARKKTIED